MSRQSLLPLILAACSISFLAGCPGVQDVDSSLINGLLERVTDAIDPASPTSDLHDHAIDGEHGSESDADHSDPNHDDDPNAVQESEHRSDPGSEHDPAELDDPHSGDPQSGDPHDPGETNQGEEDPGNPNGEPDPGEDPGEDPMDPVAQQDALAVGFAAPLTVRNGTATYIALAVDAVIGASNLNGGTALVLTGTLRQRSAGVMQFDYTPAPEDRLRIDWVDSPDVDLFVTDIIGDFSSDSTTFLRNNHNLVVRVVIDGSLDVEFSSNLRRQSPTSFTSDRRITAVGVFEYNGRILNADLQSDGTSFFEVDQTGSEFRSATGYSGSITGDGLNIGVNENWQYTLVVAAGSSASTSTRNVNNDWTADGVTYRYIDGLIQNAFRDGRPNELGTVWQVSGELLRDGQPFGRLELGEDMINLKAELVVPNQRIELQTWRR
ncbi:MAG: hypothetical protein IH986_08425 [Planctomycetes bacterium]|nr:hypothetical protein [Planctomycetota bacterium]